MATKAATPTPAAVLAQFTAAKPRLLTAAQFGGAKPPVTTAARYGAAAQAAILAYARTHTNQQTKLHFGCSAHYVGALRKKHNVPLFVPPKATPAPAPAATQKLVAPTPAAKAPAPAAKGAGNVVVAKGGKRPAFAKATK